MTTPSAPVVLTRQQARAVDEVAMSQLEFPDILLMENAGRSCVDVLCQLEISGPVVILCGKGNNGGDGLVMARHLQLRGYQVTTILLASPGTLTGPALLNYRLLVNCRGNLLVEPQPAQIQPLLAAAEWHVDAMLGTGFRGDPRSPLRDVIEWMNNATARKFAVDVPSGLDCETGRAGDRTFRADHTCTLVAPKTGLLLEEAKHYVGQLHTGDIGCPFECVRSDIGL